MELITYREIYREPVAMIPVPKNLQNQAFEVFFAPILADKEIRPINADKNNMTSPTTLKDLVLAWDELPLDLHDAFDFMDFPSDNSEIFQEKGMYLLDTNICSALIKRNNIQVLEKITHIDNHLLAINWVVAGELKFGAYKKNSDQLTQRVQAFMQSLPVLMPKPSIVDVYGKIRTDLTAQGIIIGENDLWISAHAVAENFIVVTDNTREFSRVKNLTIENWLI